MTHILDCLEAEAEIKSLRAELAVLRAGIGAIADGCLIRGYDSIAEDLCALLTPPSAEPDDEIRMPMTPGIPGVGVVVSAGPRPELVIEADPPDGDAAP